MLKGSIVALITPMHRGGGVNYKKFAELIEWHINNKTDGILVLGTTGEGSTLTTSEKEKLVKLAHRQIRERVPLIVGICGNNTKSCAELATKFSRYANCLLAITPYYNKTNEQGLEKHFLTIAAASRVPIILYNVPSRTGMQLPINVLKKLATNPRICGIKEASGDLNYASQVASLLNKNFVMLCGCDELTVPLMSIGAVGTISVLANIAPTYTHNMVECALNQNYKEASKMQLNALPLIKALFCEVNPIPVKTAMNLIGFKVGDLRLPLYKMSAKNKANLKRLLNNSPIIN